MNYVVIGNSAAGIACIEAIRSKDKKSKIAVISEEDYHIYSRCLLSYFLAGDIKEERLLYRTDDFYKANKVESLIGYRCERVIPEKKTLKIKGKPGIKFDRLLIATGAKPKFPTIKGVDKNGVFGLRTIQDANEMLKQLKKVKTIAILGGGLIGLKSAYGLSAHSKDIRVIVKSGHVLSQVLDRNSASYFEDWIGRKGISIMTGLEATEIAGDNSVKGVVLDDGKMLDCEMVVVGKGVQPNVEIAKESNLNIDEGITVDDHLRTNIDYVYSAGDVAQAKDLLAGEARINALWPNAVEQGKVAGLNMAGAEVVYDGSMTMNSVEFFGLPVISMGITRPKEGFEEIICEDKDKGIYKKIVMKGGVVVGMIFIKDIRSAGVVGALIRKRINASAIKEDLLDENFDFAKIAGLIAEHRNEFKQEEFKDIILTY